MKRYLVLLVLIFLYRSGEGQVLLGIKQGVSISSLNYVDPFDLFSIKISSITSYSGGLVFQFFTEKYLGFQAELLYSGKGFKTRYDTITNKQYERKITYLSLPVFTHFYFSGRKASPFLLLGAFTGYALGSSEKFRDGDNSVSMEYAYSRERDNKWEYGLIGGGGLKGNFAFGTIQVEGTYAFSFSSLYKWGYQHNDPALNLYFAVPEETQNTAIQISLSYLFPLNKTSLK
ncbi:MAG TPA: porin family protein [Cyclobacteriaceae bacterium]|nr:porin family protein [Cyclobacteriaceae bacterium]